MSNSHFPKPAAHRSASKKAADTHEYPNNKQQGYSKKTKLPHDTTSRQTERKYQGSTDSPPRPANPKRRSPTPHFGRQQETAREKPQQYRSPHHETANTKKEFRTNTPEQQDTHPKFDPDQSMELLLPGIKPVLELLQSNPERIDSVFLRKGRHSKDMDIIADLCRKSKVRFSLLESASFARIYEGKSQGVIARLYDAGYADYDQLLDTVMDAPLPLILVLDQVQDPGNAGTLARTLYALGGAGMISPKHNGVYLGAAAAKAAAGALNKLPVAKVGNIGQAIDTAKKHGFTIYGAGLPTEDAATDGPTGLQALDIFTIQPRLPAMLILGAEETGIRPNVAKRCDFSIHIPMLREFDSLNVAQAGAIIIGWFSAKVREKT